MTNADRFVPKVHPATRPIEPEDPMTLHATPVAGDPEVLLRAVVQEYAWMGWDPGQILALFRDPFYPMLAGLRDAFGDDGLRDRIETVFCKQGVYRFRATVTEAPEEIEPDVVRIGFMNAEGGHHAEGL